MPLCARSKPARSEKPGPPRNPTKADPPLGRGKASRVPAAIKQKVYEAANFRCQYCHTARFLLHPDHVIPWTRWTGVTADYHGFGNVVAACIHCNSRKQNHVTSEDLLTGRALPLFNPRTDTWSAHFRWSANYLEIIPISPVGRATMRRLRMNDEDPYINQRRHLLAATRGGGTRWP